jgi:hypothetical protein
MQQHALHTAPAAVRSGDQTREIAHKPSFLLVMQQ